jgi:uncharacterized protein YndB with AHSA1/START domain
VSRPESVYVVYIASTPDAVWEALTTPEFTAKYWGGLRIESEWKPGAEVRHVLPDGITQGTGEVLIADRPRVLSYTFRRGTHTQTSDPPSQARFEIEPAGEVVRLRLIHHHTGPRPPLDWAAVLSSLKSLLETGRPLPFSGPGFGPGTA